MTKKHMNIAPDLFVHRMLIAEIIGLLLDEAEATALHATLIQRLGSALDAEEMPLSVDMQNALDSVFSLSQAFRKST